MNKVYQRINWQNEPSISTPVNETNLNKIDYALDVVDGRVVAFDTTKANQSDLLQTVKTVVYNTTTGVFTFEFWNGTTVTADLNIEKIPVSFSMSPQGVITMTTADGTQYTADVSELIKTYSFVDSAEIDFTVETDQSGNKNVIASIKAGSITGEKLQPNYLADCVSAKTGAERAEANAGQSAIDSEMSSEDSEAWAVGERNGQPVPSTDPAYENNAKWWAQHGTGSSFAGLSDTNFTNLQNGQIAKYDATTHKWINTEDEGGLLPHFYIDSEAGSTVTVTTPSGGTITPTLMSSGHWECDVPTYGTYTVHAVLNGEDATKTVAVNEVREYHITDTHFSYTLSVYAPQDSMIRIEATGETYTDVGEGSTAVVFSLGQKETQYTITVTYDGLTRTDSVTTPSASGQSGSKTITFGTINLTVDEDLIGETIVMTNGTDTKSKVADSTSMVFYPNATGNWTISCEYDGETYYSEPNPVVVSSLSIPVSAEISLVHIPEGATVLPTDDIQTWLACANITDKSYTTLAEVLADRETFETLLRDSNACDYMARSTSWADNITSATGLIPVMTSNTTPSGTASSTNPQTGREAYHALDGDDSTLCNDLGSTNPPIELTYEFPEKVCIKGIRLKYARIATGKIQALDDNNSWVDLVAVTSLSDSTTIQDDYYSLLNNTTSYKKYRVYETASTTSATNAARMMVWNFQLYEDADITHNQDAMALIGKYDYCSNALLGNATWAEAIANSDYSDSVISPLVPKMTSATTPSGQVISDSDYSGQDNWKAFDGDSSTNWNSGKYSSSGDFYCGYIFTEEKTITNISAILGKPSSATPVSGKFQYYENGSWVDIPNANVTVTTTPQNYSFTLEEPIKTDRVRLFGTASQTQRVVGIFELQFYGRASSNVSNTNGIIHTAMGNDSVYCVETGDTFTATDGIATVDFSQFDEGVYTFGSTTAKNPSDLSQDYTKQFRITKSPYGGTTELYLMPDAVKTLYWWGYEGDDLEDCTTANGWTSSMYTLSDSTHNINNIYCNASGTNPAKFVCIAKSSILTSGTVIKGITEQTSGSIGSSLVSRSAKNMNDSTMVNTASNSALNVKETLTLTLSSDLYITSGCGYNRTGYIYALWYE